MDGSFNATRPRAPARTARQAVLLSALVYPGVGQAVQGRWLAALAYGFCFTAALVWFLWLAGLIIVAVYQFALNFNTQPAPSVHWRPMAAAFVSSMLLYVANVFDAWRASRRIFSPANQ